MDGGGRTIDDITAETLLLFILLLWIVVVVVFVLGLFGAAINLFQLNFTRLRGGPIGGICCVANAPYASAIRCGCVAIMFFQPVVSVTSVGWLQDKKTRENQLEIKQTCVDDIQAIIKCWMRYDDLRVDEIYRLCLQLVRTMQIG